MKVWIALVIVILVIIAGAVTITMNVNRAGSASSPPKTPSPARSPESGVTTYDFYHPPKPTTQVKGLTNFEPPETQPSAK